MLQWGVATHYVDHSRIKELYELLIKKTSKKSTFTDIKSIVDSVSDNSASKLPVPNLSEINYCFKPDSVQKIEERLESVKQGKVDGLNKEFAEKTLKTMSKHSPLSMAVVFEQIVRGSKMSLQEVFKMEYKVSQGFMHHGEFFEGVRALLIDKDNAPKWTHKSISEVKQSEVEAFFNRSEDL